MIAIEPTFSEFEQARLEFVKNLAKFADATDCVEIFQAGQTITLLQPLLNDPNPDVQLQSFQTLLRLVDASVELATETVECGITADVLRILNDEQGPTKKLAAKVIRALTKYNLELTQTIVRAGALEALVPYVQSTDSGLAESCILSLRNIASHHADLAQEAIDAKCLQPIVAQLSAPEASIKRASLSAIIEIVKYTTALAQLCADQKALPQICTLVAANDGVVRRLACEALSHFAKHSADLAEQVEEANAFPRVLYCLRDLDPAVRLHAATCVREVAKHSLELCQTIVNKGALSPLVAYARDTVGVDRLPAVVTIGFIAAYSETLAAAACATPNCIPTLVNCVMSEGDERLKSAAVWTLGQLGRHSPLHAEKVVEEGMLTCVTAVMLHQAVSDDLRNKCRLALQDVIEHCLLFSGLDPLLLSPDTPEPVLECVFRQYAKKLRTEQLSLHRQQMRKQHEEEEKARLAEMESAGAFPTHRTRNQKPPPPSFSEVYDQIVEKLHENTLLQHFAEVGGLERAHTVLKLYPDSESLKESIERILSYYPEDVVRQTNPDYQLELLRQIETFHG